MSQLLSLVSLQTLTQKLIGEEVEEEELLLQMRKDSKTHPSSNLHKEGPHLILVQGRVGGTYRHT